jgi:hypothetical protein
MPVTTEKNGKRRKKKRERKQKWDREENFRKRKKKKKKRRKGKEKEKNSKEKEMGEKQRGDLSLYGAVHVDQDIVALFAKQLEGGRAVEGLQDLGLR